MFSVKRKFLRRLALMLSVLMLAVSLAACGSGTAKPASTTAKPASATGSTSAGQTTAAGTTVAAEEPFNLEIMLRFHTSECPTPENLAVKEIERITNTKLDIQWGAYSAYDDKINVTIASGDYPMVMLITGNAKPIPVEVEAVRAGMFWKVGDYLQDYEYLKNLNPTVIKNASIDGDLWGMFRSRPLARDGMIYRADWMEKLGLSEPKNPEELYNVLKAFVNDDPDGNGQKDTGGLAQESSLAGDFAMLGPWFGLGNQWDVIDGKLVPIHMEEKYIEMLQYLKRIYDDELMNQDFPTVSATQRDELMTDKYGIALVSIDKGDNFNGALKQIHPDANLTVQQVFADAPDKFLWSRTGFDGKFYISTKAVTEESDVKKIMEFFNLMHSPEICNLISYGIEDKHYTKVGDNQITISDEQSQLFLKEIEIMEQLGYRYTKDTFEVANMPAYQEQYNDGFKNNEAITRANVTAAYNSEAYNEKGKDLDQIIIDAGIKFVTGAIDESGWNSEVERWRKAGGDQMISEFQALYDQDNK